ncbi:hypothetical protein PINS_up008357 [Pythium insidiosum]|nr:hypothetical protein PINS_up008357 [Pythium insidiosum]
MSASQNSSRSTSHTTSSVQVQASTTSQSIGVHAEPSTSDEQCSTDRIVSLDAATDCDDLFPIKSQSEQRLKHEWTSEPQDDSPSMKPEISRIKHLNRAFLEWNSSAMTAMPVLPLSFSTAATSEDPHELTPKKKSPSLPSPDPLAFDESNDENQEDASLASPKRVVTFISDTPTEAPTTRSLSLSLSRPLSLHDAYDDTECHDDDDDDDDKLPSQLFIPALSSPEAHDSPLSVCASTLEETDLRPALAVSVKRLQDSPVQSGDNTKEQRNDAEQQASNQQHVCREDEEAGNDAEEERDYIHEPLPRLEAISGVIPCFRPKSLRPMSLFRLDDQLTDQLKTKAELLAKVSVKAVVAPLTSFVLLTMCVYS